MVASVLRACLNGALTGIAVEYIAAIVVSLRLQLGYFLPYIASLPEQVGGEMNAVLLQTAVCALLGAGAGAAWRLARWKPWPARKKLWGIAASVALSVAASVSLAAGMAA
jgi:hypothetical protein